MTKTKRIFYFDLLRAIAIIGIIFCHTSANFIAKDLNGFNFYISAFFDCFRDFSIPVFVMLSGALLIGKKDSLRTFFKKRLSRLFVPFVFWDILYTIYSFIYYKNGFSLENIINIFLGKSGSFGVIFWFIWMIVMVYVMIFIINRVIIYGNGKIDGFGDRFINILTALSLIYIVLYQLGLFEDIPYQLLVYYISFSSYAIIGYFITHNSYLKSLISQKILIAITGLTFAFTYLYYIYAIVVPTSLSNNHFLYLSYFNVLILIMSVSFFLMFKYLSDTNIMMKFENKFGDLTRLVSNYSFGIYLSHYLILKIIFNNLNITCENLIILIPLLVVLTLAISIIVLEILDKIHYINKVSGKG
ncbi:acyltransferase [Methanobrevibacter sp.]|uniref:acyltransferase n=1 Tax=Methanobrevibacter sp. TaxID=66852 RepID=UPI00389075EB